MAILGKQRTASGPRGEIARLRAKLAHSEDMIRAVRLGEVDTMVVDGDHGRQLFTLEGAEQTYRILIESMNEGALTLSADLVILYANQCFARMARCPLAAIMGTSFCRFIGPEDHAKLRSCLKPGKDRGGKVSMSLQAADGSRLPVHLSIRPLSDSGSAVAIASVVVTDLTEMRRTEDQLRALTHRVVQVQEAERERLALDLHDHVTQPLCAILARLQTLAARSAKDGRTGGAKTRGLRDMISETAQVVERISHDLRPSVLRVLGLSVVLRDTTEKFTQRTGLPVKLSGAKRSLSLSADIELTLYRILQEALNNIERHARSRTVAVHLRMRRASVQMTITDDGVGFDAERSLLQPTTTRGLGLLGMHERASYVGGNITVTTSRGKGTEILVHIPLPPVAA